MAFRAFRDAAGTEWEVYDVSPHRDERRLTPRRSVDAVAASPDGDRRAFDRRVSVGGIPKVVDKGWLCFERGSERRRLSPIPEGWQKAEDARLADWLGAARPTSR